VSRDEWRAAVDEWDAEGEVADDLARVDALVVNLEGTFHHHTVGALALGAVMAIAQRLGRPVWAVNGTVEGVERWLLAETLACARYVAVREPRSRRSLAARGVRAVQAADCAFTAPVPPMDGCRSRSRRTALYTPGVLARPDQAGRLDAQVVLDHLEILERRGWDPVYLELEPAEAPLTAAVARTKRPIVRTCDAPWPAFLQLLSSFALVVSGRYHVLVFAASRGVPFVPLPSNTWKIEGLLDLLGSPAPVVRTGQDLAASFDLHPEGIRVPAARLARCRALAHRNVPADLLTAA
jgi:polysaccharide pyruvyl transferase WcaK-like protein